MPIPQFFNVLRREMSIVGPRPQRPEFIEELTRHIPFYPHRLKVRPGMTGQAQIGSRRRSEVPDCVERVGVRPSLLEIHVSHHRSLLHRPEPQECSALGRTAVAFDLPIRWTGIATTPTRGVYTKELHQMHTPGLLKKVLSAAAVGSAGIPRGNSRHHFRAVVVTLHLGGRNRSGSQGYGHH